MKRSGNMSGGGKAIFSHGTNIAKGVAVFTSNELYKDITNTIIDIQGRYIVFDLKQNEVIITIVALYAPNDDNPGFFKELRNMVKDRSEQKIVIGDFNLVLDVEIDRKNTFNNNNYAKNEVLNLMDEFMLKEVWRERNPESREYSWFKKDLYSRERKASRIDFVLVSGGLDQNIEMVDYLSSIMTDHRAMYVVVKIDQNERGNGFWKFNTLLLQQHDFIMKMNEEIETSIKTTIQKDPVNRWECIKKRIKKATTQYSRMNISEQKLILANLSEKVNEYKRQLPLNEQEDQLYEKTKQELVDKQLERTAGIMFRSKAKWYQEGETSSKYFFALEKARYNNKTCYKLLDDDNVEVTEQEQILNIQKEYYQKLYQEDKDVQFTLQNNYGITVPPEIREHQDQQITLKDLEQAIKTMNNNKTPGPDGIPIDFYKVFWAKIKHIFMQMMEHVYNIKQLHQTARNGVLNLIPKPGKDARRIKNLRPITLLNTDYKIIEKAIANKMLPALDMIINKDQRGFMKDRRISVNIRKMLDIMHQAEQGGLGSNIVLSLDFVKVL